MTTTRSVTLTADQVRAVLVGLGSTDDDRRAHGLDVMGQALTAAADPIEVHGEAERVEYRRTVDCPVHGRRAVDLNSEGGSDGPDWMCSNCRVVGPDGRPLGWDDTVPAPTPALDELDRLAPRPWLARISWVSDANEVGLFSVSGDRTSAAEDERLAELLVQVVNTAGAPAVTDAERAVLDEAVDVATRRASSTPQNIGPLLALADALVLPSPGGAA
jgi:hypothetical protein